MVHTDKKPKFNIGFIPCNEFPGFGVLTFLGSEKEQGPFLSIDKEEKLSIENTDLRDASVRALFKFEHRANRTVSLIALEKFGHYLTPESKNIKATKNYEGVPSKEGEFRLIDNRGFMQSLIQGYDPIVEEDNGLRFLLPQDTERLIQSDPLARLEFIELNKTLLLTSEFIPSQKQT